MYDQDFYGGEAGAVDGVVAVDVVVVGGGVTMTDVRSGW